MTELATSVCLSVWERVCLFGIPRFPNSRIPRFPDSRIPRFPDSQIPARLDFGSHQECLDIVSKSLVELIDVMTRLDEARSAPTARNSKGETSGPKCVCADGAGRR